MLSLSFGSRTYAAPFGGLRSGPLDSPPFGSWTATCSRRPVRSNAAVRASQPADSPIDVGLISSWISPRSTVEATDVPAGRSVAIHSLRLVVAVAPPATREPSTVSQSVDSGAAAPEEYVAPARVSLTLLAGEVRPSGVVVSSTVGHGSVAQPGVS